MLSKTNIRYIVTNAPSIYRQLRWHGTITCPYCGSEHIYTCNYHYKCAKCRKRFSDYTNTIMHGSKLDHAAWILCLYLMLDSRGISSVEVARKVGVSQKTAWSMMMKWRTAMGQDTVELNGIVSMDETYVGGSWQNKTLRQQQELLAKFIPHKYRRNRPLNKNDYFKINNLIHQPTIALADEHNVVFKVLPHGFTKQDIQDLFHAHQGSVQMCVSDCSKLYNDWDIPFEHNNHSKRQYTTPSGYSSNRIEGFFSHFKNALRHNHIFISKRYMQLYLDEMAFRWRHRLDTISVKMNDAMSHSHAKPCLSSIQPVQDAFPSYQQQADTIFQSCGPVISSVEINGVQFDNPFE